MLCMDLAEIGRSISNQGYYSIDNNDYSDWSSSQKKPT